MNGYKEILRFLRRSTWLWVSLYFICMTLVMTYPLVLRMGDSIVGRIGDNIYFVWMIGWMKKALFELGVNPFDVWFLNYPEGWNMAYTEITPVMLALAMPFALLGGHTLGYNAALLLSFALSGLGMYYWIKRMTGNTGAALVAGTIFAFIPYRFAHFLAGHLNLSGTQWLPLYFAGLFELFDAHRNGTPRKLAWKPILLCGISLGLIGLTSQYYLYMALLVSAFIAFIYLVIIERKRWRDTHFWKQLVVAGVVGLPLVLAAVAPYLVLESQGGLPDRNIWVIRPYSASPTDFILPSTDHFLWGVWVWRNFNRDFWIEATLYLGAVSSALAVLALVKRRSLMNSRKLQFMFWGGLFSLVMAMGIDLHWLSEPVMLPAPEFLRAMLGRDDIPIVLPGFFLFHYFPFYAKLRVLMRFGIFVILFVSAAAGLGADLMLRRFNSRWQPWLVLLGLGLVFVDLYPGAYREFARVEARPVDHWLAEQPGDGALIQFPFFQVEDQEQTYHTLIHGKPFVGGFFNAFPPAQYQRIRPVMDNFPDEASIGMLADLGVQFVLVDSDEYEDMDEVRRICEENGLRFVERISDQWVFERDE